MDIKSTRALATVAAPNEIELTFVCAHVYVCVYVLVCSCAYLCIRSGSAFKG